MRINQNVIQIAVTAAAIPVSIAAALFAWKQVELGREHNRLSVAPILQITPYAEGKGGKNGLFMTNDGLGPAIIKSFSIRSGGVVAEGFGANRWSEIVALTDANPLCFASGWPKGETALRAGAEVPLLVLTKADGMEACLLELIKLVGGRAIDIEVTYESMYEEKKTLRTDTRITSKALETLYHSLTGQNKG